MGSDAAVYVFDYKRYATEVVPAFRKLLLTGEITPSLRQVMNENEQYWQELLGPDDETPFDITLLRNMDLVRNCTYLTNDLAFVAGWVDIDREGACFSAWEKRACRSSGCPDRAWCPFHVNTPPIATQELNYILRDYIGRRCLECEQFVGRTYWAARYKKLMERFAVGSDDRGMQLLDYLGTRGFVIGYQWAGYGEGIHGWLDPDETREFRDFLNQFPLPRYAATLESLKLFERSVQTGRAAAEFSWDEISLSYVRTVAAIAASEQKGMLWGNDIPIQQ